LVDFVLFLEVRNHPALLSLQPTRDHGNNEVQRPDFHDKNLARAFENVRDARHRPSASFRYHGPIEFPNSTGS
jgi:hypothetical protein